MVVKVYISGISGNKEVKKRQQRVLLILDSKNVKYEVIDIAEPGSEDHKDFMQNNSTSNGATISDPSPRHPLPPQIFNEELYCGDYDQFDMANEIDEMEKFLKMAPDDSAAATATSIAEIKLDNGDATKVENGAADPQEEAKPEPEETETEPAAAAGGDKKSELENGKHDNEEEQEEPEKEATDEAVFAAPEA